MFTMQNYVQPGSLQEAYELRKKGKKNMILGGNLWTKMSSRNIATAIDLCRLSLDKIEDTGDAFKIGCMCSLRDLEVDDRLNESFDGCFKEAVRHIVGVQFRNTATVGGSIFPRFGFSDILTVIAALDCEIELFGRGNVPVKEFLNMKPDDDILVNVIVKKDGRKVSYQSHRMTETDFAILTCAVSCKNGKYTVVLGARPGRAVIVDNVILKDPADEDSVSEFADDVTKQVVFGSNMRGSGEYRKEIAKVLIKRAIAEISGQ